MQDLAARYIRAVASRNRFAHRYGLQLAEAVLELRDERAERGTG